MNPRWWQGSKSLIGTLGFQRRSLSQSGRSSSLTLSFTSVIPADGNETEKPLVILHGLFGSKRNWGSFLKAFQRDMSDRPIYAVDLRNHGSSPHATPMTYEAMVQDIHQFIQDKHLRDVTLLGHSMGGKVAMAYALTSPERLSHLIVADTAPSAGKLSSDFIRYISLMQEIEALPPGTVKTRLDADKILASYEPDMSIRQFLLTNLHIPSPSKRIHDHERPKFKVPLDVLSKSIPALGSFPYEYNESDNTAPVTWTGPTLAIKGTKSSYINCKNIPALRAFFPNVHIEELDAGHWVHAEKPTDFRKLVVEFLNR